MGIVRVLGVAFLWSKEGFILYGFRPLQL